MTEPSSSRSRTASRILLTILGLATIAALAALPTLAGPPSEEGLMDLAKFTGRFHPVVLHLPIGMLVWVLVHEFLIAVGIKRDGSTSRTAMGFAAGSAVIASLLGFVLYYSIPEYDAELAERHLYGGLAFTCLALAAWLSKLWVDAAAGRGAFVYRGLLLGSAGVMAVASHDGASLTHGSTYLTEYAPAPLRKLLGAPEKKPAAASDLSAQPVYESVIAPILEQKCYSCHNADRKRGKYRMDEYELLLAGGNDGEAIVPGDAAASNLIVRIELPMDDEEHMPPEGKKDLEDHELVLIKWWIDQGASKDALLADLAPSPEVSAALALIGGKEAEIPAETADAPEVDTRIKEEVARLQREFPAALNYESQASTALTFTAAGLRAEFGDDDLAKLEPVLPAMVSMDLSGTSLTDEGVKRLAKATGLKSLRLSETAITESSLDALATLTQLESLNLYGTQIGSPAVLKLAPLANLRRLYLWRTQVDAAGVLQLQEKLPDCEIVMGL